MKTIILTRGKVAHVDDADFEIISQFNWCAHKDGRQFYATRNVRKPDGKRTTLKLHRFLMPGVTEIDHIDGDGLNNQRANLRPASNQQNQQAFRRKAEGKTSLFRGVSWYKRGQKWRSKINPDGKQIHLGYFQSERDAALAYDAAARNLFGGFASPNFTAESLPNGGKVNTISRQ